LQVLLTHGGTGARVILAKTYLNNGSILLSESDFPYYRIINESLGGGAEIIPPSFPGQRIDAEELGYNHFYICAFQ